MKINFAELKKAIDHVKPGLSSKEITDQSDCIAFSGGYLFTYNGEISVRTPFESDIEGVVRAKELTTLLAKLKADEADITITENELKIKSGRNRAGIRLESEVRMPMDKIEKPDKIYKLPAGFIEALAETVFSAGTDMTYIELTLINCNGSIIESTDNDRASRWELEKGTVEPMLIPASAAIHLSKYNIKKYGIVDGWLHFFDGDTMFSCRTFNVEYPNLSPFFECKGVGIEFPAETEELLDRAGIFLEAEFEQDKLVHVDIDDNGVMKIRGEGDGGWFEGSVRFKHKKAIKFSIHPNNFRQILTMTNKATVGEDRILFETERFKHVVALEVE